MIPRADWQRIAQNLQAPDATTLHPWLRRAQGAQLFGFGQGPVDGPYVGAGLAADALGPYDLRVPGAVQEIQRGINTLLPGLLPGVASRVESASDALRTPLAENGTWTRDTNDKFLLVLSQLRTSLSIGGPFFNETGPTLQPTVNALELLTGALRSVGAAPLAHYELYRAEGCTICFTPPSVFSKPPSSTPVVPTTDIEPWPVPPNDKASKLVADAAWAFVSASWDQAFGAKDNAARAAAWTSMQQARAFFDATILKMTGGGVPLPEPPKPGTPGAQAQGGGVPTEVLVAGGVGMALLAYFAWSAR